MVSINSACVARQAISVNNCSNKPAKSQLKFNSSAVKHDSVSFSSSAKKEVGFQGKLRSFVNNWKEENKNEIRSSSKADWESTPEYAQTSTQRKANKDWDDVQRRAKQDWNDVKRRAGR